MAGGVFSNFTSSMKGLFVDGAAEKAILYVYLVDPNSVKTERDMRSAITDVRELEQSLMKKSKETLGFGDTMKGLGGGIKDFFLPGKKSKQKVGEIYKDNDKFMKFELQYNPATLKLYTVNGKLQKKGDTASADNLQIQNFNAKTKLSFDIVFDDCDNMNAFMFNDIANMNITSGLNKGLSLLQNGGNTHSVRKRMDAIMSLLSAPATQNVVFFWSRMVFFGTVTDVSNKFTMFNPQGNPIRGEMHLEITQDRAATIMKYNEKYWKRAFNDCFKEPEGGVGDDMVAGVAGKQNWMDKATNNPFLNI